MTPSTPTRVGQTAKALDPVWPDEKLEQQMLEDAKLLHGEFAPTSTGHDAACHIQALLQRVRELERAVRATGYFEDGALRAEQADASDCKDYFQEWKENVEYTETVDAMLDGVVPTQKDGKPLWLKERVQLLIDEAAKFDEMFAQFKIACARSEAWKSLALLARQAYGTLATYLGTASGLLFTFGTYHKLSKGLPPNVYEDALALDKQIQEAIKAVDVPITAIIREEVPQ